MKSSFLVYFVPSLISPKFFPLLQVIAVKFQKKKKKKKEHKRRSKKGREKFHVDVLFTKYERETYGPERWQIKFQDEGVVLAKMAGKFWPKKKKRMGLPRWLSEWTTLCARLYQNVFHAH